MSDARLPEVLRAFSLLQDRHNIYSPDRTGGFSGARIWRIDTRHGSWCLKSWPVTTRPAFLSWMHSLMQQAREAGLICVPVVARTDHGDTWLATQQRYWDLTQWMPGRADFRLSPTPTRLVSCLSALARLHTIWSTVRPGGSRGPCPAVLRRLQALRDWKALIDAGWRPAALTTSCDPLHPLVQRAWELLQRQAIPAARQLESWQSRAVVVQPCLCDIWHDHVLFTGDEVTGLIDYGGLKIDNVAVDLARLLGSLLEDDPTQRVLALATYRRFRSLSLEEEALIDLLDQTGVVVGLMNWLRWLFHEGRTYPDQSVVAERIAGLIHRLERWTANSRGL